MRWISVILICLLIVACKMEDNPTQNNETAQSINHPSKSMTEFKKAVLYNGDINAYNELDIVYLDYEFQEEFLLYSLIMANKYDYPQAYFDVFTCLTDIYLSDINQIDEKTASIAIDYLLKAYERKHHQAKDIIEEYKITSNENSKQQIERIFKK